ncbi:UNVERIFIED_ORG: hypothetical protein FHU01_3996 [Citrobacter freundii]
MKHNKCYKFTALRIGAGVMYSLSTPGQRPSLNTDQRLTNKWMMLITVSIMLITLYSVSNICGEMHNGLQVANCV